MKKVQLPETDSSEAASVDVTDAGPTAAIFTQVVNTEAGSPDESVLRATDSIYRYSQHVETVVKAGLMDRLSEL